MYWYIVSLRRLLNNHNFSQLQQQTQTTGIQKDEIKISINLP